MLFLIVMNEKVTMMTNLPKRLRNIMPSALLLSRDDIDDIVVKMISDAHLQATEQKDNLLTTGSLEIKLKHKYLPALLPTLQDAIEIINDAGEEEGGEEGEKVTLNLEEIPDNYQIINLVYKKE